MNDEHVTRPLHVAKQAAVVGGASGTSEPERRRAMSRVL